MAIDFRRVSITFDPTKGQTQNEAATVVFNSRVIRADVALNGFDVQFTDGDHHVFREVIDARIATVNNNTVTVGVSYLLRDSSATLMIDITVALTLWYLQKWHSAVSGSALVVQ